MPPLFQFTEDHFCFHRTVMPDAFAAASTTTHLLSLLSTGVAPQRALLSPREWRRREERLRLRQQQKPKPTTKRGFA